MLDNILNSVKRSAEKVQRKGEEVAHATRLRVEVFQLTRELDGLYARLGRSYHAGAEVDILQGVREDIRRVEDEIKARERLIQELGGDAEDPETTDAANPELQRTAPKVSHETGPDAPTPGRTKPGEATSLSPSAAPATPPSSTPAASAHDDPLNKE